jgi:mannose-6-phosphate isomerase-like protein (cupin superfamily)
MRLRKLKDCPEFAAGDDSRLRELLHPDRDYPFDARYSLAHATVDPGRATSPHRLRSSEVYYVLSGAGEMHINEEAVAIETGDAVEIPPGSIQWVENSGKEPLVFLCIVDPAWQPDDEEIL